MRTTSGPKRQSRYLINFWKQQNLLRNIYRISEKTSVEDLTLSVNGQIMMFQKLRTKFILFRLSLREQSILVSMLNCRVRFWGTKLFLELVVAV